MGFTDKSPEHVNDALNQVSQPAHEAEPPAVAENFAGDLTYIRNDAYVANPAAILGSVFYERKSDKKLLHFISGLDLPEDSNSALKTPLVRQEILVTKKAAANISILSMLTAEGAAEDAFEFRVVDNWVSRINTSNPAFVRGESPVVVGFEDQRRGCVK